MQLGIAFQQQVQVTVTYKLRTLERVQMEYDWPVVELTSSCPCNL